MKLALEQAKQMALDYMKKGYHCGPAVLQVMWEVYDMKDESFLWAGIPFMGGISGENKATCGAVSGAAVALGLRHRTPLKNTGKAKIARNKVRQDSGLLVKDFMDTFGHVNCQDLLGIDFSVPGAYQEFKSSGIPQKKCYQYINFIVEKLYTFEMNK